MTRGRMKEDESIRVPMLCREESFPLVNPEPCDYILVADRSTQKDSRKWKKQQQFKKELEAKGLRVQVLEDEDKVFYSVCANDSIFEQYQKLLMEPDGAAHMAEPASPASVSVTTRIRIVNFILKSKMSDGETFDTLTKAGIFETRFPLHKEEEDLKDSWAQWKKMLQIQPIDDIRDYFGEKVALYFTWLGWYTSMLLPAALTGLGVFLFGFVHFEASQISKEVCEAHEIYMCPLGDHSRSYQRLSDTCTFAKLTHLFDNEGTVFFAFFMALWATVFLEVWKRKRARVILHWNLHGWDEDQEEIALELINCPNYELRKHRHSFLRSSVILLVVVFMICVLIGMAHILVVYRVMAAATFGYLALPFLENQVTTAVVVTGAVVHYMMIIIMTKVNKCVALKLCKLEEPRTYSEHESKFTVKFFTLQFFAHFSSLIYIAFILGRINGHPGKSVRLAGMWKLEECHLSGCMMDLFMQMAIIMGLKQTLSNFMEYMKPWLCLKWRRWRRSWRASEDRSKNPVLQDWQKNLDLNPVNPFSLFDEFMEMMIQYGFTTTFVAAFPLAPLLAFISNLLEIRLDAIKMVRLQRRLVPRKTKDIGTWLQVLEIIGVLAVIANGMVIAFTSEFIPRMVYKYHYGPCGQSAVPGVDCLTGYTNYSLSVFYTKDFPDASRIQGPQNVTECRYRDYRNPTDYSLSEQFWVLLAIRLGFLIVFEHVALCIKLVAAWFVPDVPQSVKNTVLDDKYKELKKRISGVRSRPRTPSSPAPSHVLKITSV